MRTTLVLLLFALVSVSAAQQEESLLLRFPHVQGDRLVFVHGGDVWRASASGGPARRLTSFDEGLELSPRLSPDGSMVAFSGEYSGSRQIWVVPWEGGVPRQLTWYPDVGPMPPRGGFDNLVYDWTPDGSRILVRSNRTPFGVRVGRYFLVDPVNGGLEEPLPVPEGGAVTFSPDGRSIAYNVISREWRTWKRYRAGRAQDVWTFDLEDSTARRLTDFEGTDSQPMWIGDRIWFTSDRGGTLNLWSVAAGGGDERQHTHYDDYDVLFPSRGGTRIAFERGGRIHIHDTVTGETTALRITLADDRPWARPVRISGKGNAGGYSPSPSAARLAVDVRGEVFTVPAKHGEPVNLTRTPGRRERRPRWSPDGRFIAWLAEDGGGYDLVLHDRRGDGDRTLLEGGDAWILTTRWLPGSDGLVVTDKSNRLRVVPLEGEARLIDVAHEGGLSSVSVSADGAWLAYTKSGVNRQTSVWLARTSGEGAPVRVTSERWNDGSPSFDPEGRWLWFVSARDFVYADLDFESRLYALVLDPAAPSPLAPREDVEEKMGEDGGAENEKGKEKDEAEKKDDAPSWTVELDGLEERLVVLPEKRGTYRGLAGTKKGLLYVSDGAIRLWDADKRKSSVVLDGVRGFTLTPDGEKIVYRRGDDLCIADVGPDLKAGSGAVPLDRVSVRVDRVAEWSQMFHDAWRIVRDWFYDPGLHRVDWAAMRDRYARLLPHVAHRSELDFLLGELIGELNCGHAYVQNGEEARVERVNNGVLGCELAREDGRYRIARIFVAENWNEDTRNPLTEPGVDADVGDFILAIDGEPLAGADNPYRLLEGKAGRRVTLRLADDAAGTNARDVEIRAARSESGLRYLTWVEDNRRLVDEMSGGRIGYIHVPNTAVEGHRRFFESFRPYSRDKEALVIDDRYNGGGFIPDRMAHALGTRTLNWWSRRGAELYPTPRHAFDGPSAMLINGYSSSGGDAFPYYFRKLGLGPLIGQTTWGGLVGISGNPGLLDGGSVRVPAFAFVDTDGEWGVEGMGVAPDIEVVDDPALVQEGREPIIERAVHWLLEELDRDPPPRRPEVPLGPDRRK